MPGTLACGPVRKPTRPREVGRGERVLPGAWRLRPLMIYASAVVLAFGILGIQRYSEFIYFRF